MPKLTRRIGIGLSIRRVAKGPDARGEIRQIILGSESSIEATFFASVLHLRGAIVTSQPIQSIHSGDILLWNGEVFDGITVSEGANDGQKLLERLESRSDTTVPEIFASIEGPYAFVYYDSNEGEIWFGRDPLGRRSLMILDNDKADESSTIVLASHFDQQAGVHASELCVQSLFRLDTQAAGSLRAIEVNRLTAPTLINRRIPLTSDRLSSEELGQDLPPLFKETCRVFRAVLNDSVRKRVNNISRLCQSSDSDSRVAILFSGGLDCTTLALLAHVHIPITESIDLINVAFENNRTFRNTPDSKEEIFNVPDRQTGESSWKELCQLTPGRTWRFVRVNVWMTEYLKHKDCIVQLMRPNFTVMDLSIAAALFFAARGIGDSVLSPDLGGSLLSLARPYRSPARVFISGLGADELLAGYSRHRSAFFGPGSPCWEKLIDELQKDLDRISTRNLGRDDRIIAHFGREVRYPFLDQNVIRTLSALPVHLKCDLDLGKGIGDKLLLRLIAAQLGLDQASKFEKRAIQFGARSAKLERTAKGQDGLFVNDAAIPREGAYDAGGPHEEELLFLGQLHRRRPRSTARPTRNLLSDLNRTSEDERAGLYPSDLKLSEIVFTSSPVGQTVVLAYPTHLATFKWLSSASRNVSFPSSHDQFKIQRVPHKGFAMLAGPGILTGSTIVSERPIIIMPERLESVKQDILNEVYLAALDELNFEDQLKLAALSSDTRNDQSELHAIVRKIRNNAISLDSSQLPTSSESSYRYSAVFPVISRCNHSCSPNSRWHFDWSNFSLNLCALRHIDLNEEITVSYIEHLCSRSERQEKLQSEWGFQCQCRMCDVESHIGQQESDSRRQLLGSEETFFQKLLQEGISKNKQLSEDLIERVKMTLSLLEEEGLRQELSTFGRALALLYSLFGDPALASVTATKYIGIVGAVHGFGSHEWSEINDLLDSA